jgi:hypothetical protein
MKKKAAALMAIISAFTVMSCPVMALEPQALPDPGSIVQPRWNNIAILDVSLDKYGNIDTYVELNSSYRYVVTVELRKSNGGFVDSWQEENGDVITSYDLESGVRYYAKVTVKVYNSSGRVIETATKNSSTVTGA